MYGRSVTLDKLLNDDTHAQQCDWDELSCNDWAELIKHKPQYADLCPWGKLDGADLRHIFHSKNPHNKSLVRYLSYVKLRGSGWSHLLQTFPNAEEYCEWDKFDGWSWCRLLLKQPQFSNHCEWIKLDGFDWSTLLSEQPQFSNHCEWIKLDGFDWAALLSEQPQFAVHCNWKRLKNNHWERLLETLPSIIDKFENAQHIAVLNCKNAINHIKKPYQSTKQLHEMIWVL